MRLGGYTARQLDDPEEMPFQFADELLMADSAWAGAEIEANRRAAAKKG